jgi:NhaP-type Na+/H+ or K+/H+ antiporter
VIPSLAFFVLLLFLYSLVSGRLERTIITAPMVFTVAGMLMFPALYDILQPAIRSGLFLRLAEVGLVMLLFTDASRTGLGVLHNIRNLPARLLSTGMLLTIFLGAVAARLVFPSSLFGKRESWPPSWRQLTLASGKSL